MLFFRILTLVASLLIFILPTPALAAPTLPPTFYMPTAAELPEGFALTRTSAVGSIFGGGFEQEQVYSAPEIHASAGTNVTVFNDRGAAIRRMAPPSPQLAALLGVQRFPATAGDESYVTVQPGMYVDTFRFVIRYGAVIANTWLMVDAGTVSGTNAGIIGGTLMRPTLGRMAAHPDGV